MSPDSPSDCRINAVAVQLARTMQLSDEAEPSDEQMLSWINGLTDSSFSYSECREILSLAASMRRNKTAIQQPKDTFLPPSRSLWDQFSSFSERVMWEKIMSAKDNKHRIELLKRVDHIDDILPEWNDARDLLQNGLAEGEDCSYLDLHSKWFGHCQAAAEYQNVRMDLCSNVLNVAGHQFGTKTFVARSDAISLPSKCEYVLKLLQTWKSMWMKILISGGYDEERADLMVVKALTMIRNLSVACDDTEGSLLVLLPAHFLALVDPRANWYRCWLDETPVHRIITVITKSDFLPVLLSRCKNKGIVDSYFLSTNSEVVRAITLEAGDTISLEKLGKILHRQSLSILCSLLLHVRVRMFPWDQIDIVASPLPQRLLQHNFDTEKLDGGTMFPTQVQYARQSLLDLANMLLAANGFCDNWLLAQSHQAIECLASGCAHDAETYCQLQEMIKSSHINEIIPNVTLETIRTATK